MFDRYAAATAPSWGRRALVMASVIVHVSAAIGLIVYSICRIEEIPPPPLSIIFLSAPTPPPPPAAGSPTPKAEHPAPKKPAVAMTPTTLVEPKPAEPAADDSPANPTDTSGPSGPVGESTGRRDGVADGHGPADGLPPGNGAPKTVAMFTLMASVIDAPDPHLTEAFKSAHVGQSVAGLYRICLATDGHVSDVTALTSVPTMDGVIESHIKSAWHFRPQALPVCFVKPFKFNIK